MILETDQALLALTKTRVLGNAAVTVTFDPPARPWIQALKTPAVNFFLFDIRENTHRREVMYEQVRDAGGKVVGHRPPALRYDLHYTVTVWGAPVAMEHRILALVLRCFGALPTVPRELLPQALAQLPHEVHLTTAAGTKRGMFLNLAGEVKAGFELTATVAMPVPDEPASPPVSQAQVTVAPMPKDQAAPTPGQPAAAASTAVAAGTGAPETIRHGTPGSAQVPAEPAHTDTAQSGTAHNGTALSGVAQAETTQTATTAPAPAGTAPAPTSAHTAAPATEPAAGPN